MREPLLQALNDYLPPWPLPRGPEEKGFFETTHRICSPEVTWEKWEGMRERAGITRLADITALDCLGIPTYMAVRPLVERYQENISVYNGKGLTKMQAKVSAMMEAFERFSGERHDRPTLLGGPDEMEKLAPIIGPTDLHLPEGQSYGGEKIEWVVGRDLFSGAERMVPACAVFFPYSPHGGGHFIPGYTTANGLASGNTLGEAISQGLAELIERDAETLAELAGRAVTIDLDSIHSPTLRGVIEKFQDAKIDLILKEISSEVGIPTFFAVADEPATENPTLLCRGMGCHVNAEIAAMRAISEVAQSRLTQISGSREDMAYQEFKREFNYHDLKRRMAYWYEKSVPLKDFSSIPLVAKKNLLEDIEVMLAGLKRAGYREAIAVNLTVPEVGVPVVRMIVPGLEHILDARRYGPKARALMQR